MRAYELTFITHPELDKDSINELIERVKGWITTAGGQISKVDPWGKRTLAYPIRKQKEGHYVYMEFEMPPSFSGELERNLRYVEAIMRFLLILKDKS